mgnify:CR=1 FL=1
MENLLRIELDLYALLLIAVMMISLSRRPLRNGPPLERYFFLMAGSISFILILDIISWTIDGIPGSGTRMILHVINTLYYMLYMVPIVVFALFMDHISRQGKFPGGGMLHAIGLIIIVLFAAAAFTSPWTEVFYSLDAANRYQRGRLFSTLMLFSFLIGFAPEFILFVRRRNMPGKVFRLLALYPIPIVAGSIFQFYQEGSAILWPAVAVSLLLVHISIQQRNAAIDPISGLYNQAAFMEILRNWAEGLPAEGHWTEGYWAGKASNAGKAGIFGAILFDIDHFKSINYSKGYEKGNEVLFATGLAIKAALGPNDIAARIGADEFIVLCPCTTEALEKLESKIGAQIREIVDPGVDQDITATSACAVFDRSRHRSIHAFLQALDSLLYEKKESLKNASFQPELPLS